MYTFADMGPTISAGERLNNLVEEIELADKVGLEVYGVGEHHRPDYAASAPAIVLAAGAARTSNIRLTSAVTVLSSDDPVRVYQNFSTLDLISKGRAEIMAGRGSFIAGMSATLSMRRASILASIAGTVTPPPRSPRHLRRCCSLAAAAGP